jgi:excisionase family DNA binding protein
MAKIDQLIDALADEVRARLAKEGTPVSLPDAPRVPDREGLTKYYTVDEVAQSLGVSRPSVYRLINGGVLPITKIGACTRISAAALEEAVGKGLTKKYRRI